MLFSSEQEQRYRLLLGEEWEDFAKACESSLPTVVRCNTLKGSPDEIFSSLEDEGFKVSPLRWCPYAARISSGPLVNLGNTLAHFSGLIYLQEEVSLIPVAVLDPKPEELLLDIAAAPGSKSTQAAQHMDDTGAIVANDISGDRLKALSYHVERLGITNLTLTQMDGRRFGKLTPNTFHKVIADCPCSGEGTIRKDSRAVQEPSSKARKRLTETQKALLVSAYKATIPNGLIIYSTCTLAPEENEMVVSYLLENYNCTTLPINIPHLDTRPGITNWKDQTFHPLVKNAIRIYPHLNDTGGFFLALIQKNPSAQ
jgi:NOL1/NOP2/sun family putative RNA methylase